MKCPCGADHFDASERECLNVEAGKLVGTLGLARLIDEKGETVIVSTPDGTWDVPRIWIGFHGLKADELPELAARYGWPKAER